MAVSGERAVDSITGDHWRAVARAVELPPQSLIDRVVEIGERIPAAIERVIAHPDGDEETRAIAMRLAEPILDHVKRCLDRV
jgi:hypothetical protein